MTEHPHPGFEPRVDRTTAIWAVESLIDLYPDIEVALAQGDRPRAEEVLLQRRRGDPTGPWSARLGRFYAASVVGHYVQITDGGPFREITGLDPDGPFVAHARAQLAESSDPVLLTAAAEHLLHAPRYRASLSGGSRFGQGLP